MNFNLLIMVSGSLPVKSGPFEIQIRDQPRAPKYLIAQRLLRLQMVDRCLTSQESFRSLSLSLL
jgi:hypothetical protein